MQLLTYLNISTGKLSLTETGTAITLPQFVQGDSVVMGLRLTEQVDGVSFETQRVVTNVKASLGFVDLRPTSGYFVLRVGAGPYVTGTNQTQKIANSALPSEVQSALAAIGLTGATVSFVDGSWIVENVGNELVSLDLSGASASGAGVELLPLSFVRVRELLRSGKYQYEIRLIQSPLASTSSFEAVVPPAPYVREVQEGGSEATTVWPEIQSLTLPPAFRGTYQLVRGYKKTVELSLDDGPEEIQTALAAIADEGGTFTVTNPKTNVAHITFGGEMAGIPQDEIEVRVFSAPDGDTTFVLDLNTAEVAAALRKSDSVKPSLEIEISYEDVNDDSVIHTTTTQKVTVTLVKDLNWSGLEVAANIDWLKPPFGESYVPFRLDQIITGTQNYTAPFGDDSAFSFVITHNLATLSLLPPAVRNNSTGAYLIHGTDYRITAATINSITILTLAGAAWGANALQLVIAAAGPKAAFQTHTHTIAQIEGLGLILDDLGSRVETLETLLPDSSPSVDAAASSGPIASWKLPEPFLLFPTRADLTKFTDVESIKEDDLPRNGGLLPAVYTVAALTNGDTIPGSPEVGVIYQDTAGTVILPGYLGRRSTKLAVDELYTWDGRGFYRVAEIIEGENVFYPTDFDIELFRIPVSEKQLRLGRTFQVDFSLVAAIFNSNVSAQWGVIIDIGIPTKEGSGASNLFSVDFLVPSLDQTFIVSDVPSSHSFGLRVSRKLVAAVDTLTVSKVLYNAEETSATVITNKNFVVRARLSRFDTSNNLTDPRGLLAFNGLEATLGAEPTDGSKFGEATIN